MANPRDGILGGFDGAVGTVVGAKWRGKNVMKKKPTFSRNRKFSQEQLIQHAKFSLAHNFFRRFTTLLQSSFEDVTGKTPRGIAFRHFLDNAITGIYPNFGIDYSKVLVARGSLLNVMGTSADSVNPGKLRINWTETALDMKANPIDVAIIVAYCPELNLLMYTVNGPARTAMTAELDMPFFSGKEVQTWIAFRSEKGHLVSESTYTGAVTIL